MYLMLFVLLKNIYKDPMKDMLNCLIECPTCISATFYVQVYVYDYQFLYHDDKLMEVGGRGRGSRS